MTVLNSLVIDVSLYCIVFTALPQQKVHLKHKTWVHQDFPQLTDLRKPHPFPLTENYCQSLSRSVSLTPCWFCRVSAKQQCTLCLSPCHSNLLR